MSKKLNVAIVATVIAVAIIGALIWAVASGTVRVSLGAGATTGGSYEVVCDESIVTAYNNASYRDPNDGTYDEEGLKKVGTDIKAKAGFEKDPTCQAIVFWLAVGEGNYEASKAAYESVKSLHAQRLFADSNLRGNVPLFEYEFLVKNLSPEALNERGSAGDND